MRVGLILECTRGGPDQQVCNHLLRWLRPSTQVVSRTMDNKKNLVARCGETAALLFNDNCNRVVIVWDEYPGPHGSAEQPCRFTDRLQILASLEHAGVADRNIHLVCIRQELEAWLIADNRAVQQAMSKLTHRKLKKVPELKKPELVSHPKDRLISIYKERKLSPYQDHVDAIKIARELTSTSRIRRCHSFVRFASRAADVQL